MNSHIWWFAMTIVMFILGKLYGRITVEAEIISHDQHDSNPCDTKIGPYWYSCRRRD